MPLRLLSHTLGPRSQKHCKEIGKANERGSASVLLLCCWVICGFSCLAFIDVASIALTKTRVQRVADAASLAATSAAWNFDGTDQDPYAVAKALAHESSALIVECRCEPRSAATVVAQLPVRRRLLLSLPETVRASARSKFLVSHLFGLQD